MTGIELLALGGKAAGKDAFAKVFSETLARLRNAAGSLFTKRQIAKSATKFYTQVGKVRLVKTLWQVDKAVDIGTFYCESHVNVGAVRKKIVSLADLGTNGNLVVEGIAGQGKSIFLRYLCSVELVRSEWIPVFLELRRVRKETGLMDHIKSTLAELGLKVNLEQLEALLSAGSVLLLLDGFDEVDEEDKSWLIDQVEHLAKCHDAVRIIVSSRPQSGIEVSPVFQVVKLSDLVEDEYQGVIYRLLDDPATAGELIKRVESHGGQVKELLKTPLLVTLLVIIYKASQEIPAQLSDFYDSLFKLLLQRHDGTKPGYRRRRLCAMNDSEYRRVFEAVCYLVKKHKQGLLDHELINATVIEALKAASIDGDSEHFLTDITKITCLIVKDGEEYRFIHKSVQEYYAACFIRNKPDIISRKIYDHMFSSQSSYKWDHELRFLSEIDTYRFLKYGILPAICRYLEINDGDVQKVTPMEMQPVVLKQVCRGSILLYKNSSLIVDGVVLIPDVVTLFLENDLPLHKMDYTPIFEAAMNGTIKSNSWEPSKIGAGPGFEVRYQDLVDSGLVTKEIHDVTLEIAANLLAEAKKGLERICKEEQDQISLTPFID